MRLPNRQAWLLKQGGILVYGDHSKTGGKLRWFSIVSFPPFLEEPPNAAVSEQQQVLG